MKTKIVGETINSLEVLKSLIGEFKLITTNGQVEAYVVDVVFVNCTIENFNSIKLRFEHCVFGDCIISNILISEIINCSLFVTNFNYCKIYKGLKNNIISNNVNFNKCVIKGHIEENQGSIEDFVTFTSCEMYVYAIEQYLGFFKFINCDLDYSKFKLSCNFQFAADKALCQQIVAHAVRILELSDEGKDIIDGMRDYIKGWRH